MSVFMKMFIAGVGRIRNFGAMLHSSTDMQ